jgi:serine/threonine protein kinase
MNRIMPLNLQFLKATRRAILNTGQLVVGGPIVIFKFPCDPNNPASRKDFLREIDVLCWPREGTVRVLAYDKAAKWPWYAMEYFPGGSLTQHAGRLSDQQLLWITLQLVQKLATFHKTGGAFGDFKLDNILLSREGIPTLADPLGNGTFGLIGLLFPQQQGGTPGYIAPEIKAGNPISTTGDMYSLAATLFHLVTGHIPQDGLNLDPAAHGFTCPAIIREIIIGCSQKDPTVRATMKEVHRILNGATWTDILKSRQQVQEQVQGWVAVGLVVAIGALAVSAFTTTRA